MRNFDESTDSFGVQWRLRTSIVELPECREYPELQQRVFANAYFSKQSKVEKRNGSG